MGSGTGDRKSMRRGKIPAIVLGGSDPRPATLPEGGEELHPLAGYKGVEIRIEGRPIVEHLVERLENSGRFGPIFIAGPAREYGELRSSATLIEADGTFGGNIRTSIEAVRARHPGLPIAFITCDVLPEAATLRRLLEHYDRDAPSDLWFPLIRVPADHENLGASSWKPIYRVAPGAEEAPVEVLGGHLVIVQPESLRLDFLYRLIDLAYRTRNQSVDRRRRFIVRGLLRALLREDLQRLLALRWPGVTWKTLHAGVTAARELRDGTVTRERLEGALDAILVDRSHRGGRRVRVHTPLVHGLSLALDVDTEEEARAMGGSLSGA